MPDIKDAFVNYRMCPEWSCISLGDLKTADQIEFLRCSLQKSYVSPFFIINVKHPFGRDNRTFAIPVFFPLLYSRVPIDAAPISVSIV